MKKFLIFILLLSSSFVFAGQAPLITSISPSQPMIQSDGLTIVLTGQNFRNKDKVCISTGNFCDNGASFRNTQLVSGQLVVQLLPGDLSSNQSFFLPLRIFGGNGFGLSPVFPWLVTDGTVVISPGDVTTTLSNKIQFSATSTLSGDTIIWSVTDLNGYATNYPTIDQDGVFNSGTVSGQFEVHAQSTINNYKVSVIIVTVQ